MKPGIDNSGQNSIYSTDGPQRGHIGIVWMIATIAYTLVAIIANWRLILWYDPEIRHLAFGVAIGTMVWLILAATMAVTYVKTQAEKEALKQR